MQLNQLNPADKATLSKYNSVAQKIIYNPERMRSFLKMMGTKEGAVQAVQTVIAAIDKLKPVPPQLLPMLAVNSYMLMVDVAQEATGHQADPDVMEQVVAQILQTVHGMSQQQPQDQGMLAQMQEQGEPAGEGPGPDESMQHEGAEPAATEQAEGSEEDGMLAQMQRRRVAA